MARRVNQPEYGQATPQYPGTVISNQHRDQGNNEGGLGGEAGQAEVDVEKGYQQRDSYPSAPPSKQGGQQ